MVNNVTPAIPAVGACLNCRQLFLVTDSSSACQFCGRPPELLLPFGLGLYIEAAVQATLDTEKQEREEAAQPVGAAVEVVPDAVEEGYPTGSIYDFTCPECREEYQVLVTDTGISVVPSPPAPPADELVEAPLPGPSASSPPEETPPAPGEVEGAQETLEVEPSTIGFHLLPEEPPA